MIVSRSPNVNIYYWCWRTFHTFFGDCIGLDISTSGLQSDLLGQSYVCFFWAVMSCLIHARSVIICVHVFRARSTSQIGSGRAERRLGSNLLLWGSKFSLKLSVFLFRTLHPLLNTHSTKPSPCFLPCSYTTTLLQSNYDYYGDMCACMRACIRWNNY